MGWNFRRSIRFGPFRLNLSKKGVGASVGIPSVRVGQDASGRRYSQVSIPGTGIYRRDYASVKVAGNTASAPQPQTIQPPSMPATSGSKPRYSSSSVKYLASLIGLAALIWILLRLVIR